MLALPETANQFIEKYDALVRKVVGVYRSRNIIASDMGDELLQEVRLHLMRRHKTIVAQFKGTASFETYLSRIIMREIGRIMQKERRAHGYGNKKLSHVEPHYNDHTVYHVYIIEEIELLESILPLLKEEYPKFRLLQKLYSGMSFGAINLQEYCPDYRSYPYRPLLKEAQKLKPNKEKLNKAITAFINACEGKQNGPDAARMWYTHRLNDVVGRLNKIDYSSDHDKYTFSILFELMEMRKNKSSK